MVQPTWDTTSFYNARAVHVRIELVDPLRRSDAGLPKTWTTREAAKAARRAFLAEGLG